MCLAANILFQEFPNLFDSSQGELQFQFIKTIPFHFDSKISVRPLIISDYTPVTKYLKEILSLAQNIMRFFNPNLVRYNNFHGRNCKQTDFFEVTGTDSSLAP